MAGNLSIPLPSFFRQCSAQLEGTMWLGWSLIDESELVQLDFFDLCEPEIHCTDFFLESQNSAEEQNASETEE